MIYSINEGQQAEEYKKRKIDEKINQDKDTQENRHFNPFTGDRDKDWHRVSNGGFLNMQKGSNQDNTRRTNVDKKLDDHINRLHTKAKLFGDYDAMHNMANVVLNRNAAKDAINRHMRRHPNQYKESCGIFIGVSFI